MMAAVDIIILSSPHRIPGRHVATLSSSPSFPSPASLLQTRPHRRNESRVAPIQITATSRLANAATVQRKNLIDEGQSFRKDTVSTTAEESILNIPSDTSLRQKTTTKLGISKSAVNFDQTCPKKPPKPRAKKANAKAGNEEISRANPPAPKETKNSSNAKDEGVPMEKPPRKPRSSRAVAEGQTKLPKGRVTKASSTTNEGKVLRNKKTEIVSRHFASVMQDRVDPFDIDDDTDNDLRLQEAVKRRTNWTPPPEMQDTDVIIAPVVEDEAGTVGSSISTAQPVSIIDLLGSFSHRGQLGRDPRARVVDPGGPKKRKLIELVKTNISGQQNPATKVAAAKKRPRTITEKATSVYAVKDDQDFNSQSTPLSQYFSHPDSKPEENEHIDGPKVCNKNRSTSLTRASAKTVLSNKESAMTTVLFSPHSALRRVEDQRFVFGTCSQLARENSPTLLRDMHEATRASNEMEEHCWERIIENETACKSNTTKAQGTGFYVTKRNLWAAASNRVDYGQKDVEMVDLSESPMLTKTTHPTTMPLIRVDEASVRKEAEEDKWLNLDEDLESSAAAKAKFSDSIPAPLGQRSRPSPSQGDSAISGGRSEAVNSSIVESGQQKPNYASYPTAQLAKEIASYRFKPIKSRDKMIALLERCWEGKQMVAQGALGATAHSAVASIQSGRIVVNAELGLPMESLENVPSKSKGVTKPSSSRRSINRATSKESPIKKVANHLALRLTPKKKSKVRQIVEEISDSDTPLTPSPPRRHQSQIQSPPPPLPLKVSSTICTSKQRPKNKPSATKVVISEEARSAQEDLHRAIIMAIKSAPRSRDVHTPSWHEKILLYDPIILEDLTGWLNSGELARVGWKGGLDGDGAVSAAEVKAWCLSKSICCLWKENLRGGARSRY